MFLCESGCELQTNIDLTITIKWIGSFFELLLLEGGGGDNKVDVCVCVYFNQT